MSDSLSRVCARRLAFHTRNRQSGKEIIVLDGDLADSDGAEEFADRVPERFINAGIAEQSMVSIAAGMAACGLRPWVFSFAAFLCCRGYDQIRCGISHTGLPVTLVASHSGGLTGRNGKSHASLNDIALISSLQNIEIWCPGDEADANLCVDVIVDASCPTYIRLPRGNIGPLPAVGSEWRWLMPAEKTVIIGAGLSSHWALAAGRILRRMGRKVGVLHLTKVFPLERNRFCSILSGVRDLMVVDDHSSLGGLRTILESLELDLNISGICWPKEFMGASGDALALRAYAGLSDHMIAGWVRKTSNKVETS